MKPTQYKLSPSALNLIKECPRCFWLAQNKVWKRPAGIFPSLPSGMDKILKVHFDNFMNKGKMPPELCEKYKDECKNLSLYDDEDNLKIWRNNFKGISYTDKKGNILRGAIDNLLVKGKGNNKSFIVLDYKTRGYPLKEDTAAHYQLQVDTYNYLFQLNGHKTEPYAYLLFYIPKEVKKTGEVVFDTELVKMKSNPKNAEKIWKKALKLLAGDCPKNHGDDDCEWCCKVEGK